MEAVEPGSYLRYSDYLASARANLAAGLPIFIKEQFGPASLAKLPDFLRCALLGGGDAISPLRDWPLRAHGRQLADTFTASRHRELGAFQDLYVGLPPADAPAVFSLLQAIELGRLDQEDGGDSGVFYPLGGWGTVRDALLQAVEASGVTCMWETQAIEIAAERGRVHGIHVKPGQDDSPGEDTPPGQDPCKEFRAACNTPDASAAWGEQEGHVEAATTFLTADCIIVNADLATAEVSLLPPELRRSDFAESSELSLAAKLEVVKVAVTETATAVALAAKTAVGAAAAGGAETAERIAASSAPPRAAAREGLFRAGGWAT